MKSIRLLVSLTFTATVLVTTAQNTVVYNSVQCEGSLTPYPLNIESVSTPDSLTAVYISHVGRHGSRFPASAAHCRTLLEHLQTASEIGTITSLGQELMTLTQQIINVSEGRWGALDSLGQAELRSIATRMIKTFPEVFKDGAYVNALSSYSPRSMMSMYSFVHQLDRLNNKLEFNTTTGRKNSYLMRPFDTDADYIEFRRSDAWRPAYDEFLEQTCPLTALIRVLGRDYPFGDTDKARDLALIEYYVIAGLQAMQMPSQMKKYFTADEMNALWSCFNLRQYLQRTATTISTLPAEISSDLILNIITKIDEATEGINPAVADLRFGHAETVMPLFSLLRIPGCYYLTNYFDTVASHWKDFSVVPMAANLQIILFKHKKSGAWYARVDHNETPVAIIPGDNRIYVPWGVLRRYMMDCVPLYAQ